MARALPAEWKASSAAHCCWRDSVRERPGAALGWWISMRSTDGSPVHSQRSVGESLLGQGVLGGWRTEVEEGELERLGGDGAVEARRDLGDDEVGGARHAAQRLPDLRQQEAGSPH